MRHAWWIRVVAAVVIGGVAAACDGVSPPVGSDAGGDAAVDARSEAGDARRDDAAGEVADAASDDGSDTGLPRGVYRLRGLGRELPDDDLAPLGALAAGAEVVSLGEVVHTVGGFGQAKTRAIEYLVARHGYRLVAFESPWRTAERAEAYVQSCAGTAEDATRALHSIFWDVSVAELFGWMCRWNAAHPSDRVHVAGFDIRHPWSDEPALRAFLARAAPGDAAAAGLADGLSRCFGVGYADEGAFFADARVGRIYGGLDRVPDDDHAACVAGLDAARGYLTDRRAALTAASSAGEFELARLAVASIAGFEDAAYWAVSRRDLTRGQQGRDAAMYDALTTLRALRFAGARAALWTHNLHATRRSDEIVKSPYPGVVNLGTRLDRALGAARYVPVGLIGYTVHYNWFAGPATLPAPEPNSLEAALHALGEGYLFVDLAAASEGPGAFVAGGELYPVGPEIMVPAQHYRAVLYVDEPAGSEYIDGRSPFAR